MLLPSHLILLLSQGLFDNWPDPIGMTMTVAADGVPNDVRACPTSKQKLAHLQALRCSNRLVEVITLPAEPLRALARPAP